MWVYMTYSEPGRAGQGRAGQGRAGQGRAATPETSVDGRIGNGIDIMDIVTQNGIVNCLPFQECLCFQVIA